MARELKVYGVSLDGRNRLVVTARSMTEAARLFGAPRSQVAKYCSPTGNVIEVKATMRKPGMVFTSPLFADKFKEVKKRKTWRNATMT